MVKIKSFFKLNTFLCCVYCLINENTKEVIHIILIKKKKILTTKGGGFN